jgi:hypothetical protein
MATISGGCKCVIILVLLQIASLSGFQMLSPQRTIGNNGNYLKLKTSVLMATAQEEQAVEDFKMITEDESTLRKIGGGVIGVATIATYLSTLADPSYTSLSTGIFAAIATYRSGSEYQ